ncbi:MAG: VWA domain-containing protein [Chloroflexi bacterium]|nr:VWA domain-containing protein [Chloroflexota bacterium]
MRSAMNETYDFTAHLTRFCRALRQSGLMVGPLETADAVRAVAEMDVIDKGRMYWILRSVLVSRLEEFPVYDGLFERFWNFEPMPVRPPVSGDTNPFGDTKTISRRPDGLLVQEHDAESKDTLVQIVRTGASPKEALSDMDLTLLRDDEYSELSRIAARMIRALASRPGRRRKRHKRKGTVDLRGAFRLALSTGGDPVRIPRRRRIPRVPRLLVLLDVSGSMDRHAQLLLQLAFAVSQQTRRVETFVFSTSITRVTRELAAPSFNEALRRIGRAVSHWSGGTRIGESLSRVNTEHGALFDRHTTVLLLSDGWDTGKPEDLALEIRRMRRRVRSFVWLNPLMGTADYQPLTRSLQAAMPYVDHFVSAMDVASLRRLPQLLRA